MRQLTEERGREAEEGRRRETQEEKLEGVGRVRRMRKICSKEIRR